jgi:hypothetical protein
MNKGKLIPWLAAGLMTLVLAVGAVGYQSVYAQATTPEASTTDTVPAKPLDARGSRGLRGGPTNQDLADALGIDLATLQAAEQTAKDNALAQAVAQGLITQEQADQLTADGAALRHMRGINLSPIDMHALLADALGITTDELSAARQTAANAAIDRAVEAGTLTQEQADLMKGRNALFADEQFQSSMTSAFEEAVQQAVTSGVISQPQADQILAQSNGKGFFGRGGFRLPGMGGGHRGPRGGFSNGTTAPTITGDDL